jgi:hypothetical protein
MSSGEGHVRRKNAIGEEKACSDLLPSSSSPLPCPLSIPLSYSTTLKPTSSLRARIIFSIECERFISRVSCPSSLHKTPVPVKIISSNKTNVVLDGTANSQVFEDMIEVASSESSSSKPPVVSLDETAEELNLFLPFLV